MLKTIVAVAALLIATPSMAADSPCKGLEMDQCSALAGCRWQAATVAGEASKAGTPYKRSTKAHCRKAPAARSSKKAARTDA